MNRERTGARDLTISKWHRTLNNRYDAVDVDLVGYCHHHWCRRPLYMIEDTREMGHKPTTCLEQLCRMTGTPGWLVQYWDTDEGPDAACRMVWPDRTDPAVSLAAFAAWITEARSAHERIYHQHPIIR